MDDTNDKNFETSKDEGNSEFNKNIVSDNSQVHDFEYHKATENISFAFFLNLIFLVIVGIGAFFTNSVAILADLIDGLSDTFTLGLSWVLQRFSEKGEDEKFTYGYRRFSLLGAVITSFIVIISSFLILFESVSRLFAPEDVHASGMVLVAIFAIFLKILSVLKIRGGKTLNERAVLIHLLGDLMGWIALLIVSIVLVFYYIPFLDPLLSIAITFWMIFGLSKTLFTTFKILLLEAPANIDQNKLKNDILSIEEIEKILEFHLWSLDNQDIILTLKINLKDDLKVSSTENIKKDVKHICSLHEIENINIEFDKD